MSIDTMSMPLPELVRRWSVRRDTADPSRLRAVVPTQSCADILRARKSEILAYLAEQDAQRAEEEARHAQEAAAYQAELDGIEGLRALQEAHRAWEQYDDAFRAAMEDEHNDNPGTLHKPACDIAALNARYPRAAAYLRAESWSLSAHYVKSGAGSRAMKAILLGEPYETAIAAMEAEWSSYCEAHMWD